MGGGLSSEAKEIRDDCLLRGIDDTCIQQIGQLEDDEKIELYNTLCDPSQVPSQYNSEACNQLCDEYSGMRANCRQKLRERCDNIPSDNLRENLRYYPECIPPESGGVGIESNDDDVITPPSTGKSKSSKRPLSWGLPIALLIGLILILLIVSISRRSGSTAIPIQSSVPPGRYTC